MPRAWIEIPPDWEWGPTAVLKTSLERSGYHVAEVRGSVHVLQVGGSGEAVRVLWEHPGSG